MMGKKMNELERASKLIGDIYDAATPRSIRRCGRAFLRAPVFSYRAATPQCVCISQVQGDRAFFSNGALILMSSKNTIALMPA